MDFGTVMDESLLLHIKTEPEIIIEEDDTFAEEFNFLDDSDEIKHEYEPSETDMDDEQDPDQMEANTSFTPETRDNRYVCAVCGLSFNYCYQVLLHMKVHSGEDPRVCPICDQDFVFLNTNTLELHVMRHTGELRKSLFFSCDSCDVVFDTRYQLLSHSREHSTKDASVNLYKCSICELEFNQIRELTLHIRCHSY